MPKTKNTKSKVTASRGAKATNTSSKVTTSKAVVAKSKDQSLFEKLQLDLSKNQSYLNLALGGLIVLVLGVLLFNYFNRPAGEVGSSEQANEQDAQTADVAKDGLPGKYTVKEGDTLFLIAQSYYDDGYKYSELVKANNLTNENMLEVGQVLDIPKLETAELAEATPTPSATPEASATPSPENQVAMDEKGAATGGAVNQTAWGEAISGDTYTVTAGDWLSKIAGRAYGDVMAYEKIAQANNITNPDLIEVGTVLKLPR